MQPRCNPALPRYRHMHVYEWVARGVIARRACLNLRSMYLSELLEGAPLRIDEVGRGVAPLMGQYEEENRVETGVRFNGYRVRAPFSSRL